MALGPHGAPMGPPGPRRQDTAAGGAAKIVCFFQEGHLNHHFRMVGTELQ